MAENQRSVIPEYREEEVLADLCRESFADFVREMWHILVPERLVWNWHIQYLCDKLQEMAERVIAGKAKKHDLIINISPGTSKTLITSIMLPVWCWTRMPSMRILTVSYAHTLATDISRKSRDLIKSDLFKKCYPEVLIRDDQDAKGHYVNTAGGERYASGTGGAITGKHFHLIVVDDPLDPNAASSDADLASANRWMEETLPTRKVDKRVTPTILIMQRLHEFDPTGQRLSKADKIPVFWICLPAELTDDVRPVECRDYYVDGLMDPVRLGDEALAEAEAQGEYPYAAQFLQTPVPRGGAMFDPEKIDIGVPGKITRMLRGWDKAGTCIIAGTAVQTSDSIKPIEQIKVGEMVLTRSGLRRVVWSGAKKEVTALVRVVFDDGSEIVGTPDHRIWLVGRGWVELASIGSTRYDPEAQSGDRRWLARKQLTQSNSMGFGLPARSGTTKRGGGIRNCGGEFQTPSIGPSTVSTTARSPLDTTCITLTRTQTTTTSATSLSSLDPTTANSIMLLGSGTKRRKQKSCGRRICEKDLPLLQRSPYWTTPVRSVRGHSNHDTLTQPASSIAGNCAAVERASEGENRAIKMQSGRLVEATIASVETIQCEPTLVFDLEVEDAHEFFANGVLVHNSGGGAYTVGCLMGVDTAGKYWILDIVRGQWGSGARERVIRDTAAKDGKGVMIYIEQEPGSGGKESAEGTIRGLAGYRVRAYKVGKSDGDKMDRADALSAQVNIGNVAMVKAHWNDELLKEIRFFPRSRYMDQIDSMSMTFNCLAVPKVVLGGSSVIEEQLGG